MAEHLLTPSIRYRILSYTLSGLLVLQPVMPALAASITPVTPGTQMDKAGNGVPVVNIATPNQAGISHNQYQDFNVGKEGVILNNATDRLTQTQLGGLIQNNPNLKPGKEASGIINEVVGANRSELQGFVEVAGKQASVMVANPYGITCSGCGFINTPQATLTTGKPVLDASGVLQSVEVTKGSISIEGQGLNASQTDRVNLIARATEMNAQLHAKDLTVIAGANRVKADGTVVPIKGEGQVPTLAIDTRALGGMYANRIKLVSSETGVGVNLGNLNARQGDIQLDSHGHLTLGNTLAQGNLQVNAAQATLSGEQKAGNTIDVNAQDGLVMNDATLTSGKTISLSSRGTVNINNSRVAAGTDALGAVTPQGSLALSAQHQNLKNSALSAGNVTVKATQSLTQDTPSTLMGLKSVNVNATQATLDGKISSAQDIALTSQTLTTGKQSELNAQRNLEIKATQAATLQGQALAGQDVQLASAALTQSGALKSNRNTTLNTQSLDNAGLLQSLGSLTLNGEQLNNRGRILSGADMNVSALNLSNAGLLSAQQQLSLELQHALDVASSGQLLSDTTLLVHADDLQNAGLIRGTQSLDINSHNVSTRANSSLLSDGDVTLSGQTLSLAGLTSAKGTLSLNGQSLTTQQSAKTQSAKRIAINATTQGDLSGELFSSGAFDIKADHLIHRGNTQAQSVSLHTTAFENQGQLTSLGDLTLQSQSVNQSGTIQASGLAAITANSLDNHGVFGANSLTFNIGERLTNAPAGLLSAENALNLHARNVDNAGKLTAQALSLTADSIDNNGLLRGLQSLNIDTQRLNNRQDGAIYSQRGFALSTPALTNSGLIGSEGDITLRGQAFDNSGETHAANLTLGHKNITNASGGRLLADNVLTSNSDVLTNAGLLAADITKITTPNITNTGTLQGSQSLNVVGQTVDNTGRLLTQGQLQLEAQTLRNAGGIQASDALRVHASHLDNQKSGVMLSANSLALQSDSLKNSGLLQGKTLELQATDWENAGNALGEQIATLRILGQLNNTGKILGQRDITLSAQAMDNAGWLVANNLTLQGKVANRGLIQGSQALSLNGPQLYNYSNGQWLSDGVISVQGTNIKNEGTLQGDTVRIHTDTWVNTGRTQAQTSLNVEAKESIDNQGYLLSQGDASLQGETLSNSGTLAANELIVTTPILTNSGLLQGNRSLSLLTSHLKNDQTGQVVSGSALDLTLDDMDNAGLLQVNDNLTLQGRHFTNQGKVIANNIALTWSEFTNQQGGQLLARSDAILNAPLLSNAGVIAANNVTVTGATIDNSGILQGANSLVLSSQILNNHASGSILSKGDLRLQSTQASNDGEWQGDTLNFDVDDFSNQGAVKGIAQLTGHSTHSLTNSGLIWSQANGELQAHQIQNTGKIMSDNLTVTGNTVNNSGLWQGTHDVTVQADTLNIGKTGKAIAGRNVALTTAHSLINEGVIQGAQATLNSPILRNSGTLLGLEKLTLAVADTLTNIGQILSQGSANLQAKAYDNRGALLSAGDLFLKGSTLTNAGNIQGQRLTITPASVNNSGSLIGLDSLTFNANNLMLTNTDTGKLLSQGTLDVQGLDVTNLGVWQAQNILLNARNLNNQGAIQSAQSLTLSVSSDLRSTAGSKITANGQAALQALSIINQGEWIAKNLTMKAGHLDNAGTISGVDGLTIEATQDVIARIDSQLLSAGALVLNAASIDNQGRLQGNNVNVHAQTLRNAGQIYSASEMVIAPSESLTNLLSGVIQSKQGLTLTTPNLSNDGLIQGGESSQINATDSLHNSGKLLFAKELTLNGSDLVNTGFIQADAITQNVMTFDNQGTWRAQQQGSLTGDTLKNTGTLQAGNLTLTAHDVNNGGTVLGTSSVNVQSDTLSIDHDAALMSGGDLRVVSTVLNALGRIVALGDTTLNIINTFTGKNVVAAGKTLTIHTQGDLLNQNVMQGQAVNLHAGGALNNQGQITLGTGESTFDAQRITLDASGSVQGGGNITLTSASDILVNGFTGTAGSLTLSAINNILNTALLYAGNDMRLYAQSVKNQRGDILAGNSLWIQKDASGNANTEIVNTSGTIETQSGDITLNTAHLLNQRDGLKATQSQVNGTQTLPGVGDATLAVDISQLPEGSFGVNGYSYTKQSGPCNGHGACSYNHFYQYYYAPFKDTAKQKFVYNQIRTDVTSDGGAARIASGRNLTLHAGALDNAASVMLANKNMTLAGNTLNNQSWQSGTWTDYLVYEYAPEKYSQQQYATDTVDTLPPRYNPGYTSSGESIVLPKTDTITFTLAGHENAEEVGDIYRSVIQAGGDVTAQFADTIGNETTSSHAGQVGGTLSAPQLNTLSQPQVNTGVDKEGLTDTDSITVGGPRWNDALQDALQSISGGNALVSDEGATSYANYATTGQDLTSLGDTLALKDVSISPENVSTLNKYQPKTVDTSAYPLPTGNNGYFVATSDPDSPYLITTNPKLNGLGQLDNSVFNDLNTLLGIQPGQAPRETNSTWTDEHRYYGSSYFMDRLNLHPDYDYRFLGDAAFDTRYVSNALVNQTGSRYLNGMGSDLAQMQYLIDNAAQAQQGLGLTFGVALTANQIAALDKSILWWEASTVNGQTVMIPKLYLSPKDTTIANGSVITGNNVTLNGGHIVNSGSTITAHQDIAVNSQNALDNLNAGLLSAGGNLNLSALSDINNIGSTIRGNTVALESVNGSINNITQVKDFTAGSVGGSGHQSIDFTQTLQGPTAGISSLDSLSLKAGKDISITGATVSAGGDLVMNAWGDIAVTGNTLTDNFQQSGAWNKADSSDKKTIYHGSAITSGGNLQLQAGQDIAITGSALNAGQSASVQAGHDINLNAAQTQTSQQQGGVSSSATDHTRTTLTSGTDLSLSAGRDIHSQAAGLVAGQDATLTAGRDVTLDAVANTSNTAYHAKRTQSETESVRQQGTEIANGGNTAITAGHDITAKAAQAEAKGDITLKAGHDITLDTATESDYRFYEKTKVKSGFLSKTTTHTVEQDFATHEKGSLLSGDNVKLQAGHDLTVQGSSVVGDHEVTASAGNHVDITAATEEQSSYRLKEKKKSGVFSGGGLGFTVGSTSSRHQINEDGTTQSQSVSTIGSTSGDVSITSGNQTHIGGADLIAGKDLSVTGSSVVIEPGHDKRSRDETFEQKTSGLTVALSGAAGGAINTAVNTAQDAKKETDGRLAALQGTKAALSGVQAGQAVALEQAKGGNLSNTVGISASLGSQKSKSESHTQSDNVTGSTLTAGNNLSVTATGKTPGEHSGDIVIAGSQLKAGGDTHLDAHNDLLLGGAANTQQTTGKNSSSGFGVGVDVSTAGISASANANKGSGKENGNGTQWTETTVDSGKTVTLNSGRDTTLNGAQVSGETVTANVGRDLTLSSQQDSDRYDAKQNSVSGGLSIPITGAGGGAQLSINQDKIHSNYDSVQEQTGIYAGIGGFDITVGQHTQLDGAVIASQADKSKNSLETGTLGFSDIHNQADFSAEHQGGSFSTGGSLLGNLLSNSNNLALAGGNHEGHAQGTTQAAVSDGTITLNDKAHQKQDVDALSRDTDHANDSISPIFDKEKEQNRLKQAQLIGEIGGQVSDVIRTQGDINGLNAAREQYLKAGGKALPENATVEQKEDFAKMLRETPAYQNAMKQYGTGSDMQKAAQAVTAVLQGLAGGNMAQAVAGGLNPYVAEQIKKSTGDNDAANVLAHAVWGAMAAEMSGNSAAAGAAGAASGELAARYLAKTLYGADTPEKIAALSEEKKQNISTLSTVASGLAGGVAGDSSANALAGAQAGKNAVENNALSVPDNKSRSQEMAQCQGSAACEKGVIDKYKKINAEQHESVVGCKGAQECVDRANEVGKLQADYANRANELLEKSRNNGGLSPAEQNELSILQVTSIQLEADRNAAIHNALMSGDSSEAKQLAINSLAQVAGTSAAGIAAGIGKAGSGKGNIQQDSMLGQNGVQTASKTIWKGTGKERIDVENPNPGQRPGQLHYQDNKGNKYLYDPQTNSFPDAPKSVNNLLNDSSFKKAIDKGMTQYLGEKK